MLYARYFAAYVLALGKEADFEVLNFQYSTKVDTR